MSLRQLLKPEIEAALPPDMHVIQVKGGVVVLMSNGAEAPIEDVMNLLNIQYQREQNESAESEAQWPDDYPEEL